MQFLRSRARRLSLLALFALAVQFVLAFGHAHADFARPASAAVASIASSPSDHDSDSALGHDACAICAVTAMAGTGVASTPPALPLPLAVAPIRQTSHTDAAIPSPRLRAFPPRGPPLA
jgi:hypothetical protein